MKIILMAQKHGSERERALERERDASATGGNAYCTVGWAFGVSSGTVE
jgi:hypothetical protein